MNTDFLYTTIDVFKYFINLDNIISQKETDYLKLFLRLYFKETEKIYQLYNEINLKESVNEIDIINNIKLLNKNDQILLIINVCGLARSDKIKKKISDKIYHFCNELHFDNSEINLIANIFDYDKFIPDSFIREDLDNILKISSDPKTSDILIKNYKISAIFFYFNSKIYFFGYDTNELLLNKKNEVYYDNMVIEIRSDDIINFGIKYFFYNDILKRIKRKREKKRLKFWIFLDKNNKKIHITKEKPADADTYINTLGNQCIFLNRSKNYKIFIDNNELTNTIENYIGIDENININYDDDNEQNIYNLSIEKLINKEESFESFDVLTSNKKAVSNHNIKADIMLESLLVDDDNEKNFIDLEIFFNENKTGLLNIMHSSKPILINNIPLKSKSVNLLNNDVIQIDKEILLLDFNKNSIIKEKVSINRIDVKNLIFKYKGRGQGIDNISFNSKIGDLTCIMGPSGCGKSTLIKILLGYNDGYSGQINFNGYSFHEYFQLLRKFVGYVPQDDLLFENLTVYENLFYAGKLKCPEISDINLNNKINELLIDLGLSDKRFMKVGNEQKRMLSGGERRRLNIALELISGVDVLFLDEPTSGLSSWDSKKVIDLLWNYSLKGKIIYVVIHQPAPELYYKFNKIIFLDKGGRLAFYGDTKEAVKYFSAKSERYRVKDSLIETCQVSPDILFNVLEDVRVDLEGKIIYEKSNDGNMIPARKISPIEWQKNYLEYLNNKKMQNIDEEEEKNNIEVGNNILKKEHDKLSFRLIRLQTLFLRNFKDKLMDLGNIIIAFVVPFILVIILSFLMKSESIPYQIEVEKFENIITSRILNQSSIDKLKEYYIKSDLNYILKSNIEDIPSKDRDIIFDVLNKFSLNSYLFRENKNYEKFLFLSVIIFVFLGLTSSLSEIIKDRPKIQRERLINIKTFDYIFTKTLTLLIFASLQALIYVSFSFMILEIPFGIFNFGFYGFKLLLSFYGFSFLSIVSSMMMGFLISSLLKSEKATFTILPILIIPQIIFGGMFLSFSEMSGRFIQKDRPAPIYCDIIFSRWAYEGLLSASYEYNPINYSKVWTEIIPKSKYLKSFNNPNLESIRLRSKYIEKKRYSFNKVAELDIFDAKSDKRWGYVNYMNKSFKIENMLDFLKAVCYNHNVFPCDRKILFNIFTQKYFDISTTLYNLSILAFYSIVLFIGTVIIVHSYRTIKYKKQKRRT